MKKVLVACEFSGIVRTAFEKAGCEAWSCDLLPSDIPSPRHIQGDVLNIINHEWFLIVAHPPCVHLSVSGSKYWKAKVESGQQQAAIKFVETIWDAENCSKICIENPVGALSTRSKLGKATQYINPFEFGHPESKKTGLWLKNLPKLKPTNVLPLPEKGYWQNQTPSRQNKLPPSKDRSKIRAITYKGIAEAMAQQFLKEV